MTSFNLGRTNQCPGCPWRKAIDPNTIPNGFQPQAWAKVAAAQPAPGEVPTTNQRVNMQCHDSPDHAPQHCVGWLQNQLTVGNNVGVRMEMMGCRNIKALRTEGEQRKSFDEILTDALAMNPELEKPLIQIECPECDGWGIVNRLEPMLRACCPNCEGEGSVLSDATDARDDAAETRREAALDK